MHRDIGHPTAGSMPPWETGCVKDMSTQISVGSPLNFTMQRGPMKDGHRR